MEASAGAGERGTFSAPLRVLEDPAAATAATAAVTGRRIEDAPLPAAFDPVNDDDDDEDPAAATAASAAVTGRRIEDAPLPAAFGPVNDDDDDEDAAAATAASVAAKRRREDEEAAAAPAAARGTRKDAPRVLAAMEENGIGLGGGMEGR